MLTNCFFTIFNDIVSIHIIKDDHSGTFVDALLVDVGDIDQLAWDRFVSCINVIISP